MAESFENQDEAPPSPPVMIGAFIIDDVYQGDLITFGSMEEKKVKKVSFSFDCENSVGPIADVPTRETRRRLKKPKKKNHRKPSYGSNSWGASDEDEESCDRGRDGKSAHKVRNKCTSSGKPPLYRKERQEMPVKELSFVSGDALSEDSDENLDDGSEQSGDVSKQSYLYSVRMSKEEKVPSYEGSYDCDSYISSFSEPPVPMIRKKTKKGGKKDTSSHYQRGTITIKVSELMGRVQSKPCGEKINSTDTEASDEPGLQSLSETSSEHSRSSEEKKDTNRTWQRWKKFLKSERICDSIAPSDSVLSESFATLMKKLAIDTIVVPAPRKRAKKGRGRPSHHKNGKKSKFCSDMVVGTEKW